MKEGENRHMKKKGATWIEVYFKILSKYANQINWLIVIIMLTTIVSFFTAYNSQFGSIEFALKRERKLLENATDSLDLLRANLVQVNLTLQSADSTNKIYHQIKIDTLNKKIVLLVRDSFDYQKSVNSIEGLVDDLTINQIPLFGEKTSLAEYIFFLYLLCIGAIFWLLTVLEFTKNVLKEVFNYPSAKSTDFDISIPSLFYLILPSNDNLKFYKYFELILLAFLVSIGLIGLIICHELFIHHTAHDVALTKLDGFDNKQIFWTVGIYAVFAVVIIFFYYHILRRLKDIRNLLILLKWQRTAFFPVLYDLFQESNLYLIRGQNRMEYRQVGTSSELELCIYANLYNPSDPDDIRFIHGEVNLAKSLRRFISFNKSETYKRTFLIDRYLERILTVEEDKMREYFKSILTDKGYETELVSSFEIAIPKSPPIKEGESVAVEKFNAEKYESILKLIGAGNIKEAIDLIEEEIKENFSERREQILLIKLGYERYKSHSIKGIIPLETYEREVNRITNNLLEIMKIFK